MQIHPKYFRSSAEGDVPDNKCQICKGEEIGSEMEMLLIIQSTFYSKWK